MFKVQTRFPNTPNVSVTKIGGGCNIVTNIMQLLKSIANSLMFLK